VNTSNTSIKVCVCVFVLDRKKKEDKEQVFLNAFYAIEIG